MRKSRLLIAVAAATAVTLLAACSSNSNSATSTTSAPSSAASSSAATSAAGSSSAASSSAASSESSAAGSSSESSAASPSQAASSSEAGSSSAGSSASAPASGTFTLAVGEPDHLTPGRQTVAYDQMSVLYAPLTWIESSGALSYRAAESVTTTDRTTWTVKLRPGWTFQDGEPVNAHSYVDAWNATAYAPNAWGDNGMMANIKGYTDLNPTSGKPTVKTMSGLKVIDDLTFSVTLVGPDNQFAYSLSQGNTAFFPMPASAFKDLAAYDKAPIGNGPYKMEGTQEQGKPMTVTEWDGYQGPHGLVKTIVFAPYSDMNTAYTDVQADVIDAVFVPTDKYTSAPGDFGSRLYAFPAPGIDYLGMPLSDKRFSDPRVREAFSMAIDRDAINKAIFGGLYDPATALTPVSMVGSPTNICDACKFDPTKAKQLLADAGGWTGPLKIVYPGGLGSDQLFQAYANQIRQNLGIADVTAVPTTDWADYWDQLTKNKVDGLHFGHWGALVPTMADTLRNLFTKGGGCYPCTTYSDPDVDSLLAKAAAAITPEAANAGYVDVQKRVLQDFPIIPTFSDKYVYAVSNNVTSFPPNEAVVDLTKVTVK